MEEIESKISAINSKQYYQLGAPSSSYGRLQDEISECGSEDIDTIHHRYDPPSTMEMETSIIAKSLADEIKEEQINGSDDDGKPEPPPDLLVSSNCRRKIWPQFDIIDNCNDSENHHSAQSAGMINDAFTEDWDMILDTETMPGVQENTEDTNQEAVDIVIRQQPTNSEAGFYRNARRMIVHQIQGVEVKPATTCGNCCILQ